MEIVAAIRSGDTSRALTILDEHMRDAVGRLAPTEGSGVTAGAGPRT
jgi:DNA-binding GntR family transcriptional regulator